jgi:hypothetical protein
MSKTRSLADTVMPSAVMTEEELAAWNSLSRGEQERRLELLFQDPDCETFVPANYHEILEQARALADADRAQDSISKNRKH